MFKMLSRTGVISVSLVMSACATLPELPYNAVETADIVVNIKCELQNALLEVDPGEDHFKGWRLASSLSLRQDHNGSLSADGSLVHLLIPQIFSVSGNLGVDGRGQRTERINFDDTLAGLRKNESLNCKVGENPHRLRLLAGNLGMVNLLKRSVESMRQGQLDVSQLDYTISFIIVKSGTLDATFRMIPVGSRGTGAAGGMWRGSQTQTHTLTLNFKPPADPKTCGYRLVDPSAKAPPKRSDIATINELCPQLVVAVQVPPASVGWFSGICARGTGSAAARGRHSG